MATNGTLLAIMAANSPISPLIVTTYSDLVSLMFVSAFYPLLFIYWAVLGYSYYHRDKASRASLMGDSNSKQLNIRPLTYIWFKKYWHTINIMINFLLLVSLLFTESIPWGLSRASAGGETLLANFKFIVDDPALAHLIIFWFIFTLYFILFSLLIVRYLLGLIVNRIIDPTLTERYYRGILLDSFWLPSLKVFCNMVSCSINITSYQSYIQSQSFQSSQSAADNNTINPSARVLSEQSVFCWAGPIHQAAGGLSILMIFLIFPSVLNRALVYNQKDQAYTYIPKFLCTVYSIQFALVALTAFAGNTPLIFVIIMTVVSFTLFTVNFKLQPCLGSGRSVNHIRSACYSGWCYFSIWALICINTNGGINYYPLITVFITVIPIMLISYYSSRKYAQILDDRKIAAVMNAASNPDPEVQTAATADMVTMSMAPDSHDKLMSTTFDSLLTMFTSNASEDAVKANTALTFANVAVNEQHKKKLFALNLLPYITEMIQDNQADTQRASTALLANLSSGSNPEYCSSILKAATLPDVIELTKNPDQDIQLNASRTLLNCCRSEATEVDTVIMHPTTLTDIVDLLSNNNRLVQLNITDLLLSLCMRQPDYNCKIYDAGALDKPNLPKMIKSKYIQIQSKAQELIELLPKNYEKQVYIEIPAWTCTQAQYESLEQKIAELEQLLSIERTVKTEIEHKSNESSNQIQLLSHTLEQQDNDCKILINELHTVQNNYTVLIEKSESQCITIQELNSQLLSVNNELLALNQQKTENTKSYQTQKIKLDIEIEALKQQLHSERALTESLKSQLVQYNTINTDYQLSLETIKSQTDLIQQLESALKSAEFNYSQLESVSTQQQKQWEINQKSLTEKYSVLTEKYNSLKEKTEKSGRWK